MNVLDKIQGKINKTYPNFDCNKLDAFQQYLVDSIP